ncbi:MAG: hypothetical protein LUD46_05670 [Parabacteroides sp.]|nr:hypothetical protein [Parabacteroides sp.]
MRPVIHSYLTIRFVCLLAWLLAAAGCSDEVPCNGAGEEWLPVSISETGITGLTVCELTTKSLMSSTTSTRELPADVKTAFDTGDQLKLTYTLDGTTDLTATATKTSDGWEIKNSDGMTFKLPADFTGEVTATTPVSTPSTTGYQTNKLKAICTPAYDTNSKTFTLSFTFSQESAGLQVAVTILVGSPSSVELAYRTGSGSATEYIKVGTSAEFTKTLFFDPGEITGFRLVVDGSNIDKAFDAPLTLTKGTFYFIDLLIADVDDLNPQQPI